jgi:type II secretory pathway pseudopilin PulG
MTNKPLPLFESIAAVFGIAVFALLVALPSTGTSQEESTERLLRDNLRQVRTAVREFVESGEAMPGTSEELEAILIQNYLTEIPPNPINELASIRINSAAFAEPRANGSAGWLYVPGEERVVPDLPTRDQQGRPFLSY